MAKLLFVARDLFIASKFGRSQAFEAFIIAFLIPFTFSNTLSNSLTTAFLPKLIKLREENRFEDATRLYESLLLLLLIFAAAGTLFFVLGYPLYSLIIAGSFSADTLYLMRFLFYITAPAAFLAAIVNLWKELLNAENKFLESSAVSVITPLASIALLAFSRTTGVFALSAGLLVGAVVELVLLAYFLKKRKSQFKILPAFGRGRVAELSPTIKNWWKLFIGNAFNNSNALVDSVMAARRSELGGLAALSYGKKVVTLPIDIAATAFSTVLIPYFSGIAAKNDWQTFRRTLDRSLMIILISTVPVAAAIAVFAEPLIRLLFERGAFSAEDTKVVSAILIYYVFQLPFYVAYYLMLRILPIINRTSANIFFSAIGIFLTIFLNYVFIKFLGTSGIALSSSVVYFILAAGIYYFIRRSFASES